MSGLNGGSAVKLKSDLANPIAGFGAALMSLIRSVSGAVSRTVRDKLFDTLSPRDFGADPTGVADSTTAFADMLAAVSANKTIDLNDGVYKISAQLTKSNCPELKFKGNGAKIIETVSTGDTLVFDVCDGLRMSGITFEGPETQAYWQANSPTTRRRFVKVTNSARVRVFDLMTSGKRGAVLIESCNRSKVFNIDHTGFLQNVSVGAVAQANELPAVEIKAGRHNSAYEIHAQNHGSAVLLGQDTVAPTVYAITGKEMHDNVVYGSSCVRARVWGVDGENVVGSFVKLRGKQNLGFGNTGTNCSGPAFVQTGNGLVTDSWGANGFGSIMAFNSAELIGQDGMTIGVQDGYYPRDFIAAFNSFDQLTSTGGYAGIRAQQMQGGTYAFNTVNDTDTTIAYEISKPVGASKTESVIFFGNSAKNHNGSSEMISLNDIQKSIVAFNCGDNAVEHLIHARRCDSSIFEGNLNVVTARSVHFDTTEVCTGNLVVNNYGTTGGTSMAGNSNAIGLNYPNGTQSGTGSTPAAIGLLTTSGGQSYISVNTSSSADWKIAT